MRRPKLKQLSLRNLCIDRLYGRLSQVVVFECLTVLTLCGCTGSDQFLAEMGLALLPAQFSLRQIVASVESVACLRHVIRRSPALTALHLSATSPIADFSFLVEAIEHQGNKLRSLSLHHTEKESDEFTMDEDLFRTLCWHCRNLRQFGFQISDVNDVELGDTFHTMSEHLPSFRHLPELRTVHLRYPIMVHHYGSSDLPQNRTISWHIQKFANAFFQSLDEDGLCPKLNILIFGTYHDPLDQVDGQVHMPRHCFVKGYQNDAFGRRIAVAVHTLPYMLRELDSSMDIIDFDPGCEWVGARPGRIYDRS
ncbi:hypothetical protein K491DRAFT_594898 [Lophiostoma macrostomum CBS 122681]|uniref:F-box domain-containing protein n=1 Tax=Lophiostoma macrostomum CBS 122681 TaxID=1314788 RepID=A0A6A6TEY3_9PLEO|nr:hypothetical protein K491DRAFT_594898 [Lophiostoma macrostomum CBS 122681]